MHSLIDSNADMGELSDDKKGLAWFKLLNTEFTRHPAQQFYAVFNYLFMK